VLHAAAKLNGTDFDGDGVGDYAFCINTAPTCEMHYFFMGILGPILQTQGQNEGIYFDPETMTPLVQNAGMRHALGIVANLSQYMDPRSNKQCYPYDLQFNAGKCLLYGFTKCCQPMPVHVILCICAVPLT
jgi:hypothetical protein